MTERALFGIAVWVWVALAAAVFPILFFVTAPYGRHARAGLGPEFPSRIGWVVMEAPAPLSMALLFALSDRRHNLPALAFLALWEVHYLNRAFVFPLRRRGGDKPMPLLIVGAALCFNVVNGYLNGRFLFAFGPLRPDAWLRDPRFVFGAALFAAGLAMNLHADAVLRGLRAPGETGYRIPRGGLYRWVSCPNYLGEMLEWCGFALCTFSLPALTFAAWTVANLLPRALSNHRWYRAHFPDYPPARRAVIPHLL